MRQKVLAKNGAQKTSESNLFQFLSNINFRQFYLLIKKSIFDIILFIENKNRKIKTNYNKFLH